MRYVLAIFLPPFALLACKKPFQFVLNLIFWVVSFPLLFFGGFGVLVWLICVSHALVVCKTTYVDRQIDRLVNAIEARNAPAQTRLR